MNRQVLSELDLQVLYIKLTSLYSSVCFEESWLYIDNFILPRHFQSFPMCHLL